MLYPISIEFLSIRIFFFINIFFRLLSDWKSATVVAEEDLIDYEEDDVLAQVEEEERKKKERTVIKPVDNERGLSQYDTSTVGTGSVTGADSSKRSKIKKVIPFLFLILFFVELIDRFLFFYFRLNVL